MPRKKRYEGYGFGDISKSPIPPPETIELFKNILLRIPIFKRGHKNLLYLKAPEYGQTVRLENDAGKLLWRLSLTLIFFYQDIGIDYKSAVRTLKTIESALIGLLSCKENLIALTVVDEKTFKKACDGVANLIKRYLEHISKPFSFDQRTELVKKLYACFRECVPKFRRNGVFYCIANILKIFEIEKGNIEQIFGRIKVDYYRKKEASFPPPID